MKEHKKLYKAGKLWITATLFSLIGIALTTTNVNADTTTQSDGNQQTLVINNNNTPSSSPVTLDQTEYQDSDNIQDLQNKVNDAQQKVDQAQQDVNNAQSNVESQQSVVNNDQSTLQNAQSAYQAAGGQEGSVQENISLSSDWINTVKNYLATNGSVQQVSPSSSFGQDLSNYGAALKSQNNYITDPALQNVTVSLTSDGNLDSNTELEITRYTAGLLNPIRASLGVDQYQITQRALDDSANIAAQYSAANWTIFNHGTHDFAVLNANHFDGESLSDGYLSFDNGSTTLDNIHEAIYNSIIDMLFQDSDSYWGHMTDLAGLRGELNGIYLGVQIDKNGQVHFNGNIAMRPGYTYSAQSDAAGHQVTNTADPDTSARIPLTASESPQAEQLKQAVQEAQNQLNQDTYTLNSYQQDLTNAQSNLQQAQQELQQAQQNLTNAQQPTTGWTTDENGYKCYRDSNGNLVNGWQNIDNQWYYFNNTELVTNTIMYVPGNYAMPSGTYDFKDDGSYATNIFVMNGDKYYYFGNNGYAVTGLTQYGYNWYDFDSTYGYALTGWQDINGKRYYFDPSTKAADTGLHSDIDQYTYYFDPSSAIAQKGFITIGNDLYDFGNDYTAQSGWQYDSNWNSYYFDSSYKAVSGPYTINGDMYYFDPTTHKELYGVWEYVNDGMYYFNPTPVDGLQEIDGNVYYFENNKRVDNQTLTLPSENGITGGTYSFDNNGIGTLSHTGWETDSNGNKFYLDNNGNLVTGWRIINNQLYYFSPLTSVAYTGLQSIDNKKYYFDPYTSALQNGLINVHGKLYDFNGVNFCALSGLQRLSNGELYYFDPITFSSYSGWKHINGVYYYFAPSAVNGLVKIDGNIFYFKNYKMVSNQTIMIKGKDGIPGGYYVFNDKGYGKLLVNGWQKKNGKWSYQKNGSLLVGWQKLGNTWYHFDRLTKEADTGWHKINNTWYYFNPVSAGAVDGLRKINGCIYYFENTRLITNQTLKLSSTNGLHGGFYYFDNAGHGELLSNNTGWLKDKNDKWLYNQSGSLLIGWHKINNTWYHFDRLTKEADTGWHKISNDWYYFNPVSAGAVDGLCKIDGSIYYFENTKMIKEKTLKLISVKDVPSGYYAFDNNGHGKIISYLNGWQKKNGKWSYQKNGSLLVGWQKLGNTWYHFDRLTKEADTGWHKINNTWYYFNPVSAGAVDGLRKINGCIYYFENTRLITNQTLKLSSTNGLHGGFYYFDNAGHGELLSNNTGWLKDKNDKWLYNQSGSLLIGWHKINNTWYHFDRLTKEADTGWHKISNDWYYFNPVSAGAVDGLCKIDGSIYYFKNTKMITNSIINIPLNDLFPSGYYIFDNQGHGKLYK